MLVHIIHVSSSAEVWVVSYHGTVIGIPENSHENAPRQVFNSGLEIWKAMKQILWSDVLVKIVGISGSSIMLKGWLLGRGSRRVYVWS